MKNSFFVIIICLLLVAIGVIQYHSFKINKKDQARAGEDINQGVVKGSRTDSIDLVLPEIKSIQTVGIPTRKKDSENIKINAKNYILIHEESNYPLVEKDSHVRVPIASTTKIMTAIVALENYKLDDAVNVSQNAALQIGSDAYLKSNEKLTVKSLLYALLINSGNDAAMALAEHMSGGKDEFVKKMNDKVKYLSLNDTEFKDPAGLDDSAYSSAFDLAIITLYALRNPDFKEIIKTQEYTIVSLDGKLAHSLKTSNRLIKPDSPLYMQSAIGVKTGFTPDAGHCLVSAANKNGESLVGVVLNTLESTNDASAKESNKLLNWGYKSFEF